MTIMTAVFCVMALVGIALAVPILIDWYDGNQQGKWDK